MKLYGVPLNVLLNSKSLSIEKFLNVKSIFPRANLDEEDVLRKLKGETGLITKLNTKNLKNSFEDFKEAIQEGSGYIFKSLFDDGIFQQEKAFCEHDVLVYLQELKYDNQSLLIKLLKIVQILPNQIIPETKENKTTNRQESLNVLISDLAISLKDLENYEKQVIQHEDETAILNNENEDKIIGSVGLGLVKKSTVNDEIFKNKIKQEELRKYKENLFSKNIPTHVKIFWICVVVFVLLQLIVGIIELYFTIISVLILI